MERYRAFRVHRGEDKTISGRLEELELQPPEPGEVVVDAAWSGINFKDALAATGKGAILRSFPLVAGIDVAGVVAASADERYKPGDQVLVTGCGMGESRDGGFAEKVRVPGDWLVPLPEQVSLQEAMILGTAGFTAAICVHRLEANGQTPEMGQMVVTGASGGVGMIATAMLGSLGYEVLAVSGKPEQHGFLRELGATETITPEDLALKPAAMGSVRFGGAIDNVGGGVLDGLIPAINLWGSVAAVGMAGGHQFSAAVYPFILRGVSLLGISSANCPRPLRLALWERIGRDLKPATLGRIHTRTVPLTEIAGAFDGMMDRRTFGRTLVDCRA